MERKQYMVDILSPTTVLCGWIKFGGINSVLTWLQKSHCNCNNNC